MKGVWKAQSVGVSNLEEYEGGLIKVSVGEECIKQFNLRLQFVWYVETHRFPDIYFIVD